MGEDEDYIKLEHENEYININYIDLNTFLRNIKNTEKGILQNMTIQLEKGKKILEDIGNIESNIKNIETQINQNDENIILYINELKDKIRSIEIECKNNIINLEDKISTFDEQTNTKISSIEKNINQIDKNTDTKISELKNQITDNINQHLITYHKSILEKILKR